MESLYHQTNKLIQEVQGDLGKVERTVGDHVHLIENEIQARIDHIVSNCERLEILVNKEPPTRRAHAKMRVDQLKYDCQHIQAALRQIQHKRYVKEEEEREREALLTRTFTTNDQDRDTSIQIDAGMAHNERLQNSHRDMDNLLGSGNSIIDNLRDQRVTLKGAHKKMLDVANVLGLSNTVMRLIEKRSYQDKYILFGGMVVTCVIMYLVWSYLT
ncbi:Golgi SNAP receptor complex member 2-like [Mizuhopecten yessoensis]|uniref:Golgi SNAP receptor complex member 2 n=1 Tax=Mizuhopecten yessoensis TaxID=6573 RepID=A0A210QMS3_MIZYE|nr:Golgi SNAP receptor complex member 2-like [Mizuhopecten yessoensis]OWF50034.1 Golgi SNAP receptor complex member 2 [Mizuhopecten yessoensis]